MNAMDTSTATHYSEIEVRDLVENLAESDTARLLQIYRTSGCTDKSGLSNQDVLNEVVVKALSLERRWPKDVKNLAFFIETGKSIISNEQEKYSKRFATTTIDELSIVDDDSLKPTNATAKLSHAPAETHIEHSQSDDVITIWTQKIQQLFKDDTEADCFIKQKRNEQKKSNILVLCKFTDQVYRNVEKRIKNKVRKKFPNGFPWWEIES